MGRSILKRIGEGQGAAALGLLLFVASYLLSNLWRVSGDHQLALRLYQFGTLCTIALYAWAVFWIVSKYDVFPRLVWGVLAVAETFSVVEYGTCKLAADHYTDDVIERLWGVEIARSSCERLFGNLTYIPYVAFVAVIAYVVWRAGFIANLIARLGWRK